MIDPITLSGIFSIGGKLIDKLFPDPEARAEAQLKLAMLAQAGELEEMKTQMSAILAEAQSADPWTSRARPSFLYVIYIMILASIPIGVLSVFAPEAAAQIAAGMKAWLAAIPESMWALFGVGYSGYALARSWDKRPAKK